MPSALPPAARHVKFNLLRGYCMTDLRSQQALVATPEKALLDLVYLQPGGDYEEYLRELRLQNLDRLNIDALRIQSDGFNKPKVHRAVEVTNRLAQSETQEYQDLPSLFHAGANQ